MACHVRARSATSSPLSRQLRPLVFGPVLSEAVPGAAGRLLEPCYPALATCLRRAMYALGADITNSVARRSCLVVAPHPDDETLGAAVTIMRKLAAGTPVRVLIATDGSKSPPGDPAKIAALRREELRAACNELGVSEHAVEQLPFVDAELETAGETLVAAISDVVARFEPDEILVTSDTDPHEDHAALAAATRRAVSGKDLRVLAFPVWQFDRPPRLLRMAWRSGRPEIVSTDGYLGRKQRAIAAYDSQLAPLPNPDGLTPSFLQHFEGPFEIFFPVRL